LENEKDYIFSENIIFLLGELIGKLKLLLNGILKVLIATSLLF